MLRFRPETSCRGILVDIDPAGPGFEYAKEAKHKAGTDYILSVLGKNWRSSNQQEYSHFDQCGKPSVAFFACGSSYSPKCLGKALKSPEGDESEAVDLVAVVEKLRCDPA